MKKRKKLIPLSQLLKDECLGDIAKYSDSIYIDVKSLSTSKKKEKKIILCL